MKWSSEIAEDRQGNIVVFNYAQGKLPSYPPSHHRILYSVESEKLNDEAIKKEAFHHFVISTMLLG